MQRCPALSPKLSPNTAVLLSERYLLQVTCVINAPEVSDIVDESQKPWPQVRTGFGDSVNVIRERLKDGLAHDVSRRLAVFEG